MVMRRFFITWLVLIPLSVIFVVFAVANRHLVTVSFDPFNSTDPSVAIKLPLFVLIIAGRYWAWWRAVPRPGCGSVTGAARRGSTRPTQWRRAPNWPTCTPALRAVSRSALPR
jgi:hypothetical protein